MNAKFLVEPSLYSNDFGSDLVDSGSLSETGIKEMSKCSI